MYIADITFFLFFICYFPFPIVGLTPPLAGLTTQIPIGQIPVGEHRLWTRTLDRYTRTGLPEICAQQKIRATAWDNTGRNTKDTHWIPGHKLNFLTPLRIEPGPPGWKTGIQPATPRLRPNKETLIYTYWSGWIMTDTFLEILQTLHNNCTSVSWL